MSIICMLIHNYATPECFVGVVLSLVSGGRAARWCTHHKKRQIQSITISTVSAHPSATLELLPYSLTVSQQYDGLLWRSYNINYRVAAAASANQKWLRLDNDLVTRFFTGRARSINPCYVYDSFSQRLCRLPHGPKPNASSTEHYSTLQEAENVPQNQGVGHLCRVQCQGGCTYGER